MNDLTSRLAAVAAALCCAFISVPTAAQAQRPEPGRLFEQLDENGDDVVDAQELEGARRKAFERADANGDDYVDGDEVAALGDGQRRGSSVLRRRMAGDRQPASAGDLLARLDADGDGRISAPEFVDTQHPLLERFDGNRDGRITRREMDDARAELRDQMRQRRGL